ncbi:MAG: SpoIIE family protein phosphatase [Planctomycetota bacterium]
MTPGHLLVLSDGPVGPAEAWAQAVCAGWPGYDTPRLKVLELPEGLPEAKALAGALAVWLISEALPAKRFDAFAAFAAERRLPMLVTCPSAELTLGEAYDDGVIGIPPGTPVESAAAVASAVLAQARTVGELRDEVRLLTAHQGGLSSQVSKLDEELRLAAQLQQEFLPRDLPAQAGVEFGVIWRPAGYVSGDIYDVEQLDEHHIGFFLADAVGHGVPAALMTVFIKRSLQTKAIDPAEPRGYRLLSPHEAIAKVNRALVDHQQHKVRFCTACYGIIDTRTRELTLARAGHPFPIVLRADGRQETLEPDGGLLGVFEEDVFEPCHVRLDPGDRLLLYSDGFETAFPDPEAGPEQPIANERYTQEFEDFRQGPVGDAMTRFEGKLDQQIGSLNQRDDLTILCLSVSPDAPTNEAANPVAAASVPNG